MRLELDWTTMRRGELAHQDVCYQQPHESTKDEARRRSEEKTNAAPMRTTTPPKPPTIHMLCPSKCHQCILYSRLQKMNARIMWNQLREKWKSMKTMTITATTTSERLRRVEPKAARKAR